MDPPMEPDVSPTSILELPESLSSSNDKPSSSQPIHSSSSRRLRTRALIGTHSKCGRMSVYIEKTRWIGCFDIIHQDTVVLQRWTPLQGMVVIHPPHPSSSHDHQVYVQVTCTANDKSFLMSGRGMSASMEQSLYSEIWHLTDGKPEAESIRYPFRIDFKHKLLPQTSYFDAGFHSTDTSKSSTMKPIGVTWELHAFLATPHEQFVGGESMNFTTNEHGAIVEKAMISLQKHVVVGLPIHVAYHYHTSYPPSTPNDSHRQEMKTFFKKADNVILTVSMTPSHPISYPPQYSHPSIHFKVQHLQSCHTITRIQIHAKQLVEIQLDSSTRHSYKKSLFRLEEAVPPRYEKQDEFNYSVEIDFYEKTRLHVLNCLRSVSFGSSTSQFARVMHVLKKTTRRSSEESGQNERTPSSLGFENLSVSSATQHIRKYNLPFIEENLAALLKQEEGVENIQVTPICSSPPVKLEQGGAMGVSYYFKVIVYISDPNTVPGITLERKVSAKIPFIVSSRNEVEQGERATTSPAVATPTANPVSTATMTRTPDSVGRILSLLLDDLEGCLETIPCVQDEWITLWRMAQQAPLQQTLCTVSADHLSVLKNVACRLEHQIIQSFGNVKQSDGDFKWPQQHVPFNHLILESELLVRTGPRSDDTIESNQVACMFIRYLTECIQKTRDLVLRWASLRGKTVKEQEEIDYKELVEHVSTSYSVFMHLLNSLK